MLESVTSNNPESIDARKDQFTKTLESLVPGATNEEKTLYAFISKNIDKIKDIGSEAIEKDINIRKAKLIAKKYMGMKNSLIYRAVDTLEKLNRNPAPEWKTRLNEIIPKVISRAGEDLFKSSEEKYRGAGSIMFGDKSEEDIGLPNSAFTELETKMTALQTELNYLQQKNNMLENDLEKERARKRAKPLTVFTNFVKTKLDLPDDSSKDTEEVALEKARALVTSCAADPFTTKGNSFKKVLDAIEEAMKSRNMLESVVIAAK